MASAGVDAFSFQWQNEAARYFNPPWTLPDTSKEYIIHLDASDSAVGATLSQEDSACCVKLITCMSKKPNSAEKNYPTHEREFLALLQALRHWWHYVLRPHVVAYTDNVAFLH